MSQYESMPDEQLLIELTPTAEKLFERHMTTAKEWFPHEMVPWSRGRDFAEGEEWDEGSSDLSPEIRDVLRLNLLTEENLPHYFNLLSNTYGSDGVWGEWNRRWTAEEGRHSIVIRDYLAVTNAIDLKGLERGRMAQVSGGQVPNPEGLANGITYVAMQELATRISHRNTGKQLKDPAGQAVMERVARDENLHYLFYRDLVTAGLEIDPSTVVGAIWQQVRKFDMPGAGIEDYLKLKKEIAIVGIFGTTEFKDEVVEPLVTNHWKLEQISGLSPAAEQARDRLSRRLTLLGEYALKEQEKRQTYKSQLAAN